MTARRVDCNHAAIRDGLRDCGYTVEDTAWIGHGIPDLLVCAGDVFVMFEIKGPRGELTEAETRFHAKFYACPVYVVRSLDEALHRLGEVMR